MADTPTWKDLFETAVRRGDVEMLRAAIAEGLPLEDPWLYGAYTPVQFVVLERARAALLDALIEAGADVNVRVPRGSDAGHTALMIAARRGRQDLVKRLLAAGADVHVADDLGCTAITEAANGGATRPAGATQGHTAIVRALLAAGARPDAQTLLYAAWGGNPEIAQLILDAGVGPNEPSRLGLPLVWAFVTKGRLGIAEVLLRAGADPDLRATTGQFAGLSARGLTRAKGKAAQALLAAAPGKPPPAAPPKPAGD
jgi:ankyrin repeat protein